MFHYRIRAIIKALISLGRRGSFVMEDLFDRLSGSKFRSRFHLTEKDKRYVREKGMDVVRKHASDFVAARLAPSVIANDGKQTPMRGHPVFIAQHATACCCRGCLMKWHGIPAGTELSLEQQRYIVDVLMHWIELQMEDFGNDEDEENVQLTFDFIK